MSNTVKYTLKLFFINVGILIGGMILIYILSSALFATVFTVAFGNIDDGFYATNVFIRICLPVANCLAICLPRAKNIRARIAYLNALGDAPYSRKKDLLQLLKTKEFYIECIIFAALYVVMFFIYEPPKWIFYAVIFIYPYLNLTYDTEVLFMADPPKWIYLVAILVFFIFNLWHHTVVHKLWAKNRIRFGRSSNNR